MDTFSLLTAAVAFVGAEFAKKCGGLAVDQAFAGIKAFLKNALGREPQPDDITPETLRKLRADNSPAFVQARAAADQSSVLRRAQLVSKALEGASVLWVDDHPQNNAYESRVLAALGVRVEFATSTDEALAKVRRTAYDVILSDMARSRPDSGLTLLKRLRDAGCRTDVIFYVGQIDEARGVPPGAFAITNQPEPLLHYVLDVLERRRL